MAKSRKNPRGLGDVVKAVTDTLGIEQCEGCQERQFTLNRLFPFKRVTKEMTDSDKQTFNEFMQRKGNRVIEGKVTTIEADDVRLLNDLYLTYFGLDNSGCPNCSNIHKTVINDLLKLSRWESQNT
jgi:hypothetical protein